MILVFDLDDTLYEEITFVYGGLKAVANHLSKKFPVQLDDALDMQISFLKTNGRGKVFNDILKHYGVYSERNLKTCLHVYRSHNPSISLSGDALNCFEYFQDHAKYIVTDGNKHVQKSKISALGLESLVKRYFITRRFGIKNEKPSPYCFLKICNLENACPKDIIYIGDNPTKDFVNIKKLGFQTVRIHTGPYKDKKVSKDFDAKWHINSLDELKKIRETLWKST
jgi:putative hydrolase of the HAD superfamily